LVSVVQGGEDADGGPRLNFQNVDKIYDFFVAEGMTPFVELGFMPSKLSSGAQTIFDYRANVTPPADWSQWARLVRRFTEHLVVRYGIEQVLGWHFEVWNEPDLIGAFWTGTQEDYFRLYAEGARAVKSVDPRLRVGGPATSKTAWVPAMLDYCAANDVPVDFVSTHHYGVDADLVIGEPDGPMYYRGPSAMARDVARVRAEIAASAFPDAGLHFTEWNVSPAHEDVFGKDTAFTAAFALQSIKEVSGLADSYMWWTLSDIFEESGAGRGPFSGKYGLLNLHASRNRSSTPSAGWRPCTTPSWSWRIPPRAPRFRRPATCACWPGICPRSSRPTSPAATGRRAGRRAARPFASPDWRPGPVDCVFGLWIRSVATPPLPGAPWARRSIRPRNRWRRCAPRPSQCCCATKRPTRRAR
ncbi:MAG: hypothetical protein ABII82_16680, partial [Verrucomicrobiota bacterium]